MPVDTSKKQLDVVDILKNSTRFMIHGLLSIYPELSLSEIKKMTGKSKATLVEHLKEMINSNLVTSREEEWRGSMKKKWYRLTPDADEQTEKVSRKKSEKTPEEDLIDRIETYRSFAETKRNLLQNWAEYLTYLKKEIENGHFEEVAVILNEMKDNHELFTSSSYYSHKNAITFIHDSWYTYQNLENKRREEAGLPVKQMEREKKEHKELKSDEQEMEVTEKGKEISSQLPGERPYFASVDLIPIKRVFDFKAKKYVKSQKSKKGR